MARIIVVPERLLDLSRQMGQEAALLREMEGRLGRALGGLDWAVRQQANVEGQVHDARNRARALAEGMEGMAHFLTERAQAFQQADQEACADWDSSLSPFRVPTPVPTPTPDTEAGDITDIIRLLDDLLKPIDWISDSQKASRIFNRNLEAIGRMLNALIGHRGHIKMMRQLGNSLRDIAKGVGFLSNVLDVRDMDRYFSGQLTNAQIAKIAVKKLVLIPIVSDRVAQWMVQYMPNPNGKWKGLVPPVE